LWLFCFITKNLLHVDVQNIFWKAYSLQLYL